jgi:hypothetical protein
MVREGPNPEIFWIRRETVTTLWQNSVLQPINDVSMNYFLSVSFLFKDHILKCVKWKTQVVHPVSVYVAFL